MSAIVPDSHGSFDQTLEDRIFKYLIDCDAMVIPPLQITGNRGTVTLRGHVDTQATRRTIVMSVREVPGVARVIDEIEIAGAGESELGQITRHQFSPGLIRYFEERRQGLVSDSSMTWDS
jgi:osmotically-inducible protein OsmY